MVVVLVLSSAAVGALALVLMRKATAGEPAFSVALLWSLVRRPVWLAGVAAMVVEFVLQLLALAGGPVSLVQLLVVMELPFCLLLSRLVLGGRLAAREWSAVGALTVGVVVLLVTLAPHGGRADSLDLITWLRGLAVTIAVIVAILVAGRRRGPAAATRSGDHLRIREQTTRSRSFSEEKTAPARADDHHSRGHHATTTSAEHATPTSARIATPTSARHGTTAGIAAASVGHATRSAGIGTTALAGIAAGTAAGLAAVLVKPVTSAVGRGLGAVLATWQTWAVLVVSAAAFLLLQNALRAGHLVASQPGITLANPLVAAAWGVVVFHEQVRTGWWLLGAGLGAALLVGGAVLLSGSPLLAGDREVALETGHGTGRGVAGSARGSGSTRGFGAAVRAAARGAHG